VVGAGSWEACSFGGLVTALGGCSAFCGSPPLGVSIGGYGSSSGCWTGSGSVFS
jgi:hypothetical protein